MNSNRLVLATKKGLSSTKPIINDEKKTSKHFPTSVREWNNSIYVFNKNALNLIPSTTVSAMKIIKSYFSLFNNNIEGKMRKKRLLLRFRRLSSNKIYVSNGEFKHTNNKVVITLYFFNRQKDNYLLTIKKWYLKTFFRARKKNQKNTKSFKKLRFHKNLIKKLNSISKKNTKSFLNLKFHKNLIKKLNSISKKSIKALKKANNDKYLIVKALNTIDSNWNNISLSDYVSKFYKKVLKKSLRKLQLYFYYKQLMYINKSKFNYTYLQYLKNHLESVYNKNVEFNLVNLKRFYLNSDILSEAITLKITRNRRKMLKYLNNLKNKVKIQDKKIFLGEMRSTKKNVNLIDKKNTLEKFVLNNLKYRHVTGFRLEAKGRLTRRYTASRSLSKLKYKGNLLNIDSSYRGLSSVLLKGNLKSNVQYTKLNSKTRIGSFGIKGWVSGN